MSPSNALLVAVLAVAAVAGVAGGRIAGLGSAAGSSLTLLAVGPLAQGNPCDGRSSACLDSRTLVFCADVGAGYQPLFTSPCNGGRFCYNGQCLAEAPATPTTTTPAPTTTTPAPTTRTTTTPAPSPTPNSTLPCGGRVSACNDCHSRTVCARLGGHFVAVLNETCAEDAPYCVDGKCTADLPDDSSCRPRPPPESTFRCYASGYLPDPADCTRYHLCVGEKAYDFDCGAASPGLVYDQARALCVPAKSTSCFTFDCCGRVGQYLTYGGDQTLYALCVSDNSTDALVSSCPPAQRLQAVGDDPMSVQCAPFCPRRGRFADPDDTTGRAFLECFTSPEAGADLIGPLKGTCPPGTTFDPASERCRLDASGSRRPDAPVLSTTPSTPQRTTQPTTTARPQFTMPTPSTYEWKYMGGAPL